MILNDKIIEVLDGYNIDSSKYDDVDVLLDDIDEVMTDNYLDEDDEPLEDFRILQRVYDKIFDLNTDGDGYAIEE